jgi:hypothetical protein
LYDKVKDDEMGIKCSRYDVERNACRVQVGSEKVQLWILELCGRILLKWNLKFLSSSSTFQELSSTESGSNLFPEQT